MSVPGVLPIETALWRRNVDVHCDSIELHRHGKWTDPAQGFKEERVVAQDIGVQRGHASFPRSGEQ